MNEQGWPAGPSSLKELLRWPVFNAQQLLVDHPQAHQFQENFRELLGYRLELHNAYSGMGTGSFTLHMQFRRSSIWPPVV